MNMTKDLVFGSKEWMDELNKRVKFPQMIAVHVGFHKETDKTMLSSMMIETRSTEPKNLRFDSLSPSLVMALSPYKWLIEGVYYFTSADEYLTKMEELRSRWKVEFNEE